MERALEELTVTALRNLLIEETKQFIVALDSSSTEDLNAMKYRLRRIFDLIADKEKAEIKPLPWVKRNPTSNPGEQSST